MYSILVGLHHGIHIALLVYMGKQENSIKRYCELITNLWRISRRLYYQRNQNDFEDPSKYYLYIEKFDDLIGDDIIRLNNDTEDLSKSPTQVHTLCKFLELMIEIVRLNGNDKNVVSIISRAVEYMQFIRSSNGV